MKITKEEAQAVMSQIREAQRAYAEIAGNAKCEKSRMIFTSLDIAKLMTADEVLDTWQDPELDIYFANLQEAMDIAKRILTRRLRNHGEIADIISAGIQE